MTGRLRQNLTDFGQCQSKFGSFHLGVDPKRSKCCRFRPKLANHAHFGQQIVKSGQIHAAWSNLAESWLNSDRIWPSSAPSRRILVKVGRVRPDLARMLSKPVPSWPGSLPKYSAGVGRLLSKVWPPQSVAKLGETLPKLGANIGRHRAKFDPVVLSALAVAKLRRHGVRNRLHDSARHPNSERKSHSHRTAWVPKPLATTSERTGAQSCARSGATYFVSQEARATYVQ